MKILVLLSIISVSIGRPEPPSSYQYSAPSIPNTSYGAPVNQPLSNYGPPTSQQYGPPSQPPVVHKHVYVHVPPPEPDYVPARKPIQVAPPQKHYKIVFIKAPSPPAPTAPVIPLQPLNEEKTLVYVLVKRPDEQPDIVVPTQPPTQPSKPEVYFIRYKTQKQESTGPYPDSVAPAPSGDYGAPPPQLPSSSYGVP